MKFQFECSACGICCKKYKIIINLVDALRIFHSYRPRFNETFKLIEKSELQLQSDFIYDFFKIQDKEYLLSIISGAENGCVFLKDNKCSIHNLKPSVCFFYPLKFNDGDKKISVEKHEICNGSYNTGYSDWPELETKFSEYSENCDWHNHIVEHWNQYYSSTAATKDFIIFFYEILYPIFIDYLNTTKYTKK